MEIGSAMSSAVEAKGDLFMKLLVAQLQNQNPMEPMSNSEMVSQMAQLATLDGIGDLNDSFEDVLRLYQLVSGTGLLGREVIYTDGDQVQRGQVGSVFTAGDEITLDVDGVEVNLDQIERIL